MTQYNVTGMSCAACQARVEKAVSAVPGVTSVAVSLLTNSMGVEGDAKPKDVIRAVKDAGYGASEKGAGVSGTGGSGSGGNGSGQSASYFIEEAQASLQDTETPKMLKRLGWSVGFLLILMYFSMGAHMWGWPLPSFYTDNHIAMGLTQMLLAIVVMIINKKFFISGFKSLWHRAPNMDTLVALGSAASFLYSTYALFAMTRAQVDGGSEAAMPYMNSFYFESAAMILALITVGKTLESYSKGKTTNALKGLLSLAPKVANVERTVDGSVQEVEVPVDQVVSGDIFVVRPGEQIPVDGFVLEGSGAVDESSLTGESIPVDKTDGDTVSAGTMNQSGFLRCKATRVGQDTTLSQIIKMVSDAAATKAPIAKIADKVSGVFVPAVIGIALLVFVIWLLLGQSFAFAMTRAVSVLVISCPCALGLATPVAIMVGNGKGARNGILFKTAVSLEETGKIAAIALDKTGTITEGKPRVTDLIPLNDSTEGELLQMAYLLERRSEHPLAKAIVEEGLSWHFDAGDESGADGNVLTDFTALPGNGLSGTLNGVRLIGGNLELMRQSTTYPIPDDVVAKAEALAGQGKTPMFFAADGELLGIIAVADVIKEDSYKGIQELRNMGIHVVMLTGDNQLTANAIAASAGVDEVIAGVLPDGKAEVIRQLQQRYGKVAMVGDGINDAPALTMADMGIAIGAGTDVAIDAADVVLMNSKLTDVSAAVRLSRQTLRNIKQNLFWAFFYNVICIPLAAGCYHSLGLDLNPMIGAAAMSLSSFCVVMNALRLNLFQIRSTKHDKPRSNLRNKEGAITMNEKTIKVEGMMCCHCEASVKKALEEVKHVVSATADHESGTVTLQLEGDVKEAKLKKAVEDAGYKYLGLA